MADRPRTVRRLAYVLVSELSPMDLPVLSVVTSGFAASPAVQHRMAQTLLPLLRRQSPTAFDSELGSLTTQLTLVVLNGVVTGAFDTDGGPADGWWARGRLRWRLWRRRSAHGADAVVPLVDPAGAAHIARHGRRLAVAAGLDAVEADRFAETLRLLLTGAVSENR